MNLSRLIVLSAFSLWATASAADVYRWVDADGKVHFSDRPQSSDAQRVAIHTSPTRPLATSPDASENAPAQTAASTESEAPQQETDTQRKQRLAVEKLREENCGRARDNLFKLENSRKIYDPLPDGERRYLDDDERNRRKVQSQTDIDKWCAPPAP